MVLNNTESYNNLLKKYKDTKNKLKILEAENSQYDVKMMQFKSDSNTLINDNEK